MHGLGAVGGGAAAGQRHREKEKACRRNGVACARKNVFHARFQGKHVARCRRRKTGPAHCRHAERRCCVRRATRRSTRLSGAGQGFCSVDRIDRNILGFGSRQPKRGVMRRLWWLRLAASDVVVVDCDVDVVIADDVPGASAVSSDARRTSPRFMARAQRNQLRMAFTRAQSSSSRHACEGILISEAGHPVTLGCQRRGLIFFVLMHQPVILAPTQEQIWKRSTSCSPSTG